MEIKMGKELNVVLEIANNTADTQVDSQLIKLDELQLAYVGGGEALINL